MRRLLLFILFILCFFTVSAQQGQQFSLYNLSPHNYNPAYTGVNSLFQANVLSRAQWIGLDGAPITIQADAHLPIYTIGGGAGFSLNYDEAGAITQTKVGLSYAFVRKIKEIEFSIGARSGFVNFGLDGTQLLAPDGNYENIINHNDGLLPTTKVSSFTPFFDAGLYLSYKNIEFNLSAKNILPFEYELEADEPLKIEQEQTFYSSLSYKLQINDTWSLKPSALLKLDNSSMQLDAGLNAIYSDLIWLGVGYRGLGNNTNDAVVAQAGITLKKGFSVAYAYDFGFSDLNSVHNGSHELGVHYQVFKVIGKPKTPAIIFNPRYF